MQEPECTDASMRKVKKIVEFKAVKFNRRRPEDGCSITYWMVDENKETRKIESGLTEYRENGGDTNSEEFIEAAINTTEGAEWLDAYQKTDEGVDVGDQSSASHDVTDSTLVECVCGKENAVRLDKLEAKCERSFQKVMSAIQEQKDQVQNHKPEHEQLKSTVAQLIPTVEQWKNEHTAMIDMILKYLTEMEEL